MTDQEREELIEKMKQGILRASAKRNCIIAGAPYNENNVDEFDICEAVEHARAALDIAEQVIREDCAKIADAIAKGYRVYRDHYPHAEGVEQVAAAIREGSKGE